MTNSARNTLLTAATFVGAALVALAVNVAPAAAAKSPAMPIDYNALDQSVPPPDGWNALAQSGPLLNGTHWPDGLVTLNGSVIGADPDPNIRVQLFRDPYPDGND